MCTLLFGITLIAAWIVWEWKFAPYPMVPGELFKGQRIVGLAYVVAFAAGMNFFRQAFLIPCPLFLDDLTLNSILNFFPITFTSVYDPDPVKVGLRAMPPSFTTAIGAILFNAALSVFPGHAREVLLVAVLLMTCFAGSLAVMTPDNEQLVVGLGSIASLGIGGVIVPAATVAMIVCPDALITTAAALSLSIRTVGGSIGYSIYYNVFATKLEQNLPKYVAEYAIKAGLPVTSAVEFVTIFLTAPATLETTQIEGVTPAVIAGATRGVQWAYSQSLKYVWVSFKGSSISGHVLTWSSLPQSLSAVLRSFAPFCYQVLRSIRRTASLFRSEPLVVSTRRNASSHVLSPDSVDSLHRQYDWAWASHFTRQSMLHMHLQPPVRRVHRQRSETMAILTKDDRIRLC